MTTDELFHNARSLEPVEKLKLIYDLWDSLPAEDWPSPSDAELAEVQRRSAEYDAGREPSSSWPEARERLRARLERDVD